MCTHICGRLLMLMFTEPQIRQMRFDVQIFSNATLQKPKNKRSSAAAGFEVREGIEFDTTKAQLLVRLDGVLSPPVIDWDNFLVEWRIVRRQQWTILKTEDDYNYMMTKVFEVTKGPWVVQLRVEESTRVRVFIRYSLMSR